MKYAALFNYDNGDAMVSALVYLESTGVQAALTEALDVVESYDQGYGPPVAAMMLAVEDSWELSAALVRRRAAAVERKRAETVAAAKAERRAQYEKLRAEFEEPDK